jgi:predicted nucleic acid-binding protein
LKIYPITEKIGWLAADQQRKLREKGITVGTVDATQAAICLANNLILVTSNKRHYKDIAELKIL